MEFKSWLRKGPQPVYLLCDGKKVMVSTSGSRRWAETAETVISMGASHIEAYDKDGGMLRAVDLEVEGEAAKGSGAGVELAGLKGIDKLSELAQIAAIVGEISDRAAARHESAYKLAFDKLAGLVDSNNARLANMEASWVDALSTVGTLMVQLAEARAEAAQKDDEDGGLIKTALEMGMAQAGKKPADKANGHAKPTKGKPS